MPAGPVLAHGGLSAGADNVATLLVIAAIVVLAWWRMTVRRAAKAGAPKPGWLPVLPVAAVVLLVAAVVTPSFIRTTPSKSRPASTARLAIVSPTPGETFGSSKVKVQLTLTGGKLAALDAPIPGKLPPNKGHIHLTADKQLLMIPGLEYTLDLPPGPHTLTAEYAAVDHGPFSPPVVASVSFTVAR